ncbi:MAG: hypothetical protein H5T73_09765 [Actinobacteria bacterium]|nr:hypothetical protein [Actinomycetota bacterium]
MRKRLRRLRRLGALLVAAGSLVIISGLLMPLARDTWGQAYNGFAGPRYHSLELNRVAGMYGVGMVFVAVSLLACAMGVLLPSLSGSGKWASYFALLGFLISFFWYMAASDREGFGRMDVGFAVVVAGEACAFAGAVLCGHCSRRLERLDRWKLIADARRARKT